MDISQDAPDTIFLAEDEASLYLQATTMRVWSPRGQTPVTRVATQRDMVHFYGCLNLSTGEEVAMRAKVMNSETTTEFLEKITQKYPEKPILILWDRAKWHGGASVKEFLEKNSRIEVMKLPAGSPDLNPQEHVWKQTREHVSHNHQILKLDALVQEFESYLSNTAFKSTFLDRYGFMPDRPILN